MYAGANMGHPSIVVRKRNYLQVSELPPVRKEVESETILFANRFVGPALRKQLIERVLWLRLWLNHRTFSIHS